MERYLRPLSVLNGSTDDAPFRVSPYSHGVSIMRSASIVLMALHLGNPSLHAKDVDLVRDGLARAEIVVAEATERSVRFAASDLQTYVQKINGARLPIMMKPTGTAAKLFVGRSPYTDALGIKPDGLQFGAYCLVSGED